MIIYLPQYYFYTSSLVLPDKLRSYPALNVYLSSAKSLNEFKINYSLNTRIDMSKSFLGSILYSLFITCTACSSSGQLPEEEQEFRARFMNIDEYIEMKVTLEQDTIELNDTLRLDICFHNISDTVVYFYPYGNFELYDPSTPPLTFYRPDIFPNTWKDDRRKLSPDEKYYLTLFCPIAFGAESISMEKTIRYSRYYIERERDNHDAINVQRGFLESQIFKFYIK